MKLKFLGTRGNIEPATRRHQRHTATEVCYRRKCILLDCGADWRGRLHAVQPEAIVLTHGHPDHAGGLTHDTPVTVYATAATLSLLEMPDLPRQRRIDPRRPFTVHGIRFEAFHVEHSTRCPTVGFRISAGRAAFFYAPDVAYLPEQEAALTGVDLYVGDGATVERSLVRKSGNALVGHAPIRTQLTWCRRAGVRRATFTHCGSQIVGGDERKLRSVLRRLAERNASEPIEVQIAYDGMETVLR